MRKSISKVKLCNRETSTLVPNKSRRDKLSGRLVIYFNVTLIWSTKRTRYNSIRLVQCALSNSSELRHFTSTVQSVWLCGINVD